jgi:hypothetical protein
MKRYMVIKQSGRKFMVEEWGNPHVQWGNIDPATKQLQKVAAKEVDVIDKTNSCITKENGFKISASWLPALRPWLLLTHLMPRDLKELK